MFYLRIGVLILLVSASLVAQGPYPLVCTAMAANVPIARAEGLAEEMGQIVVVCSGGMPVPNGQVIVTSNVQVFLNTNITSRVIDDPYTEALLLIDEPGSYYSPGPQLACGEAETYLDPATGTCPVTSANGDGTGNYSGQKNMLLPQYSGAGGLTYRRPNVWRGRCIGTNCATSAPNSLAWLGVPLDPPGTGPTRVIRIVNIRANANGVPTSGTLVPSTISALISISGAAGFSLVNPNMTVAIVEAGLTWGLRSADNSGALPSGGLNYLQCVPNNAPLAMNPTTASAPNGVSFVLRISENFGTAFRVRSTQAQNSPGTIYNTESMFYNPDFSADFGHLNLAGLATQGTRFLVRFSGPPGGLQVHAPITGTWSMFPNTGSARLIAAGLDGSGSDFTPVPPSSAALNTAYKTDMVYVYEMDTADPAQISLIDLPFYIAHTGQPYVTPGTTTVSVNYAPTSIQNYATGGWVPRFADLGDVRPLATLSSCSAQPKLFAAITSKSGTTSARVWSVQLTNSGPAPANNARITGFGLTQTYGAACTPVVLTPLPATVGTIAANGGTGSTNLTIDFTSCPSLARFTAAISYAADGGAAGTSTFNNLFR